MTGQDAAPSVKTQQRIEPARLAPHELAGQLVANLGTTLVAYMANVRSRQMPARWAKPPGYPGHADYRDPVAQRLQLAYRAFASIRQEEDADIARSWLIGANPWLGGNSPASCIRDLDASRVLAALDAFLNDTGGA